ncbi:MAG: SWIM zinc finger family protein [Acidobacteriota bacterium]
MLFDYRFKGSTTVANAASETRMSFAPDTNRQPTYFYGELAKQLEFREAISALHDVVVSDLRTQKKDKTAYKEWAAQQEQIDWQLVVDERSQVGARIKQLQEELDALRNRSLSRFKPYYEAQSRFRMYAWKHNLAVRVILDPVITVHPDEVFFECFSKDESSYARLGASYEVFKSVGEFACGTTNIDYSAALYDEFQKIRTYKNTRFEIDPSGFDIQTTNEEAYKEVKIDLPDSWVRGFLQVNSAMAMPMTSFYLHPMDVHNLCFVLRRHKEKVGPRSMRYHLKPGEPVRVVFEPFNIEVRCPRSIFEGTDEQEIRVWGRRRILTLERLIPVAKQFTVHLLGTGLPSFYVADLGDMSFTLGLSGWTVNDWSRAGNFDLLAPRAEVDSLTKQRVFDCLKERWLDSPDVLASRLQLDRAVVLGALGAYTQAGRAIFDLNKGVYRVRELSNEPLPMDKLRFASEREEKATGFIRQNAVTVSSKNINDVGYLVLQGSVQDTDKTFAPSLTIDRDERLLNAQCTCNWHKQNKLFKGPCEHLLALRMKGAGR